MIKSANKSVLLSTWLLWILSISTLVIGVGHFRHWVGLPADFRAFYSAGKVVQMHHDPYRLQPLLQVEQSYESPAERVDLVTPSPIPPYELYIFSLVAAIPVHLATICLAMSLVVATVTIAFCIGRLSPMPFLLAIPVVYFSIAYLASEVGQIAPIAIAAISLATLLLHEKRYTAASIALACSMLQPQFAAPAIICAFIFVPQMRVSLLCCGGGLAALTLRLGLQENLEYPTALHLQALAESQYSRQYSLTWLLYFLRIPQNVALMLGSFSTICSLLFAIWFIARNRIATLRCNGMFIIPASLAVLGGTYVHEYQMAIAVLAAIIVACPDRAKIAPAFAIGLFTIPFSMVAQFSSWHMIGVTSLFPLLTAFGASWAVLYYAMSDMARSKRERVLYATGATASFVVLFLLLVMFHAPDDVTAQVKAYNTMFDPNVFVQIQSIDFLHKTPELTSRSFMLFFQKLPAWSGATIAAICACLQIARTSKNVAEAEVVASAAQVA